MKLSETLTYESQHLNPPPDRQDREAHRTRHGFGTRQDLHARAPRAQRADSGFSQKRGFEGGQMPLHRRLPKRGFTNIFKKQFAIVNLGNLEKLEGDTFTPDSLLERRA